MSETRRRRALRMACWLTIVGLATFVWSVIDPGVISVMVALSVGQAIGTLASLIFVVVVIAELRKARVLASEDD